MSTALNHVKLIVNNQMIYLQSSTFLFFLKKKNRLDEKTVLIERKGTMKYLKIMMLVGVIYFVNLAIILLGADKR